MIEQDNIQELFSKAFENQTAPVRPELWAGVQAKMAAAGVASSATVATKGLSALTKWLIGSAAVGTVGVVATVVALNSGDESTNQQNQTAQKETTQIASVTEDTPVKENTLQLNTPVNSNAPKVAGKEATTPDPSANPNKADVLKHDLKIGEDTPTLSDKKTDSKTDDKKIAETKQPEDKKVSPAAGSGAQSGTPVTNPKGSATETSPKKYPENTDKQVFAELEAKVTHFPNAFSPNNDGENDTYFVKVENIADFRLIIFDDHNRLVFETNDPKEAWDGRNQAGEEAPEGMYAAVVTGKQQGGKSFRDIQMFQLMRQRN
ncbi:gliding motility-associated C-terminal domain-containing protein [Fluviicola sp.]|uniref:gliding motility-associated C-terminal domain-containing protein n=1 Tax=Fluviicola sp. TaxID=1917219 RepID=UPI0031DF6B2D